MHELGIVIHVIDQVETIAAESNAEKVVSVTVDVGEVSAVVPDYFRDCFEWSKKKTKYMRDAELNLIVLQALSYCTKCEKTYLTTKHAKICPHCGSGETYLVSGNELNIKDIAVL